MTTAPYPFLALFVPGDRPDRFAKAATSGADATIVDLEDAVAPVAKAEARDGLSAGLDELATTGAATAIYVRINAPGTPHHDADIAAVAALAPSVGLMLPKAEDADGVADLSRRLPGREVIALIETPHGLANARALAGTSSRLAFGSLDYAVSIGARHTRPALEGARRELVLASALAGRAGPIDGVTTDLANADATRDDADYAASLGFAGKLLVHPRQIAPARAGFAPTTAEIARAREVLDGADGGASNVGGEMVDAPVLAWARSILSRAHQGEA